LIFDGGGQKKREMFEYEDFDIQSCQYQPASQSIFNVIEDVKVQSKQVYEKLKDEPDCQIGLDLLHLFLVDILGRDTASAKIFQNKANYDFRYNYVVTVFAKKIACFALIAYNVVIANLAVMATSDRSNKWQLIFATACIVQFVLEVLFTTVDCVVWHYTLPVFIFLDLKAAVRTMVDGIDHAMSCAKLWRKKNRNVPSFETTSYFFVSRQASRKFPHILECSVVLSYMSIYPNGTFAQHFNKTKELLASAHIDWSKIILRNANLSFVIGLGVKLLGSLPVFVQLLTIRSIQPLLLFALLACVIALSQNTTMIFIPVLLVLFLIGAEIIKPDGVSTLILPLPYKISNEESDSAAMNDDYLEGTNEIVSDQTNTTTKVKPLTHDSARAKKRWGRIQSSVNKKGSLAMKKVVSQAKAQKLAKDQFQATEEKVKKNSKELTERVDEREVHKIATLISESTGISMDEAREIAKNEIMKQFEIVLAKENEEFRRQQDQQTAEEPLSYGDMMAQTRTSNNLTGSQLKSYASRNYTESPSHESTSGRQHDPMEILKLANRMTVERSMSNTADVTRELSSRQELPRYDIRASQRIEDSHQLELDEWDGLSSENKSVESESSDDENESFIRKPSYTSSP